MAQDIPPQLYLSLLSGKGRYGDVSREESRDNEVGLRLSESDCSFGKNSRRVLNVLDALAAICVHNDKGDIFFVSLSMNPDSSIMHVSSNGTVPTTLIDHLKKVRGQLKLLKDALILSSPTSADIESPDASKTPKRMEYELMVEKTIYRYSYKKVQRRFAKRGPAILARYNDIVKNLEAINPALNTELLYFTHPLLRRIEVILENTIPQEQDLIDLIDIIAGLSMVWRDCLESTKETVLTWWDDLNVGKTNRNLSLRRLLQKIFILHHHIRSILRIARSQRLSPFLEGQFDVVLVPAVPSNICIQLSENQVFGAAFPPEDRTAQDVRNSVYAKLLDRFQTKAKNEGIEITTGELKLSLKNINVHAECTLLAYHLQNPEFHPYRYFGGSKLSCHACGTFFSAFNNIAESFGHPHFFTRGCLNKLNLRWPSPSLLSQVQQEQLKPGARSLDIDVREEMNRILGKELVRYVDDLRKAVQSSRNRSGESHDGLEVLRAAALKYGLR